MSRRVGVSASSDMHDTAAGRIDALCLALPGATRENGTDHVTYRVKGRPFAYFLDGHDPDGIVSLCCRAAAGENEDRARREPDRFYLPRYIGKRGWFGLRLDRGRIRWREVGDLLAASHAIVGTTSTTRNSR
jgi:predicted DNA-binding protein (MmcQ/YjbR family)